MIAYMGRGPAEQATPEFSTDTVRDRSAASPKLLTETETAPQRYILPKNLRNAVKHLSDGELDLMHAATLEEMKRRGRTPQSVVGKSQKRRHVDTTETPLTRGQINAVRAAFKAGITPSRIARQFGISQSNVRKALASDESIR